MDKQREAMTGLRYVRECFWIIYAIFFQPFSFKTYLAQLDPELQADSNYFEIFRRSQQNPKLTRFLDQVRWGP
ncbi:MAG: hypothetical protein ACO34J_09065 [Prochlorothrix sp.]